MLQSIERPSGLPIAFNPLTCTISWPDSIAVGRASTRTLEEMKEFIREPQAKARQDGVYHVYRNLSRHEDAARIRAARVRYDITVIPPGAFAGQRREFLRTAGHYHALKPGTAIAYPEVYEVIAGRAYWLLQRPLTEDLSRLEETYIVEAGPGEKAVMLPRFGHISINASDEPLVIANWISDTFQYDYQPYHRFHGGGYWVLEGDMPDTVEFERNHNYASVPELKKLRPKEAPELGLERSRPLYSLAHNLDRLSFLNNPEEFTSILTLDHCYRTIV
ncbi:MAG: glucose-6-phosphate isomerase family protein [Patescibacteria group bacterium]